MEIGRVKKKRTVQRCLTLSIPSSSTMILSESITVCRRCAGKNERYYRHIRRVPRYMQTTRTNLSLLLCNGRSTSESPLAPELLGFFFACAEKACARNGRLQSCFFRIRFTDIGIRNDTVRGGVHVGGRLVQNEHLVPPQDGPGEADELRLARRQVGPALADRRIQIQAGQLDPRERLQQSRVGVLS